MDHMQSSQSRVVHQIRQVEDLLPQRSLWRVFQDEAGVAQREFAQLGPSKWMCRTAESIAELP